MSNEEQPKSNRKPTYTVSSVREGGNGKSYWNRIGAAWNNRDGSITVQLECVPLDGRIILQQAKSEQA